MDKPKVGEVYKHYKGGLHKVVALAKHSETLEDLVIYTHEGNELSEMWARPLSMWNEEVEINGQKVPRFVLEQ